MADFCPNWKGETTIVINSVCRMNLSNAYIPPSEIELLQKGRNFALPPMKHKLNLESVVISDAATGIRSDRRLNTTKTAKIIKESIYKLQQSPAPVVKTFSSLKRRLNSENLVLVKADKGEAIIIMERAEYDRKILTFLTAAGASLIRSNFHRT